MAEVATLVVLHELMDSDGKNSHSRETRKWGEKEKREWILQQHHKRVNDRRSGWI